MIKDGCACFISHLAAQLGNLKAILELQHLGETNRVGVQGHEVDKRQKDTLGAGNQLYGNPLVKSLDNAQFGLIQWLQSGDSSHIAASLPTEVCIRTWRWQQDGFYI